jgi:[acyl-carrier-protein] S-malonyltransferase
LAVGGAFHSPLMQPASRQLEQALLETPFASPGCPIYQNVDGLPQTDPAIIKDQLIKQLTSPVRWTTTIQKMTEDGMRQYIEVGGTGKVLQAMVKRISPEVQTSAL